jgi:hypothetical protein
MQQVKMGHEITLQVCQCATCHMKRAFSNKGTAGIWLCVPRIDRTETSLTEAVLCLALETPGSHGRALVCNEELQQTLP